MTDRDARLEGATVCPFVALGDDRDLRSVEPDHRHRCFAELTPAPRAIAHQRAYCLAPNFPNCPTFQEWARREAAREVRPGGGAASSRSGIAADAAIRPTGAGSSAGSSVPRPVDPAPAPTGSRAWDAPPPWLRSGTTRPGAPERVVGGGPGVAVPAIAPGYTDEDDREAPEVARLDRAAATAGPAADDGSWAPPVDRRPAYVDPEWDDTGASDAPADAGAGRPAAAAGASERAGVSPYSREGAALRAGEGSVPPFLADRVGAGPAGRVSQPGPPARGTVAGPVRPSQATRLPFRADRSGPSGPAWEAPRRFEAYPTLRTRVARVPRALLLAAALAIAAVALLLFAPSFGQRNAGVAPSSAPTEAALSERSPAPSARPRRPRPTPTPQIYVVRAGDTLASIAEEFALTQRELLAANRQIRDPDRIRIGDKLRIPMPGEAPEPTRRPRRPRATPTP